MRALLKVGLLRVGGLAAICAVAGWCGQKTAKPAAPAKPASAKPAAGNPKAPSGDNPKGTPAPPRIYVPLNPMQRFLMMTPEEQERVLEKAPPPEQTRLRQAIDRFNRIPPAQRERLFQVYQAMSALPPAQQALVTRQMNAFNKLPDDRRELLGRELRLLLRTSAAARESRFASEDFTSKYSPEEQQMLRDLAWNLPPDYPLPGKAASK
ncbi:MAG: DUF3106 domain-containing protein [Bryobacteraceae bacterium]|jgi:hypothetical protein